MENIFDNDIGLKFSVNDIIDETKESIDVFVYGYDLPTGTSSNKLLVGNVWRSIVSQKVLVGGAWRDVSNVYINKDGMWRLV